MINVVAMWLVLSSLGGAMLLSPEPLLVKNGDDGVISLDPAREATRDSIHMAAEAGRRTGEAIKRTVSAGLHSSVAGTVKETSQAGLEKLGLAASAPEPSRYEQWQDGLHAAKAKIAGARPSDTTAPNAEQSIRDDGSSKGKWEKSASGMEEVLKENTHGAYDASKDAAGNAREKLENLRMHDVKPQPPTTADVVKDSVVGAYEATKSAAGDSVTAVRDRAATAAQGIKDGMVTTGDRIQDGAHSTFKTAEEAAAAAKAKLNANVGTVKDTVFGGKENGRDTEDSVGDLASRIAKSVQENINTAGSQISGTAESARDSTYSTVGKLGENMGAAYEYAGDALKDAATKTSEFVVPGAQVEDQTYLEKMKLATEEAGDRLKRKGKDAVSHMPSVGQGLSIPTINGGARENSVDGYAAKAGEWLGLSGEREENEPAGITGSVGQYVESAKDSAGNYHENAKETLMGPAQATHKSGSNWREEFLNKVGIREEADVSKYDIVVGNFKGYWQGPGVLRKAGEALNSATAATHDRAHDIGKSLREKASKLVREGGENLRATKDVVVDKTKHVTDAASEATHDTTESAKVGVVEAMGKAGRYAESAGKSVTDKIAKSKSHLDNTYSNITEGAAQNIERMKDSNFWKRFVSVTTAWLLSSVRTAHLLSFSSVYGSSLWVTFISGYLLSRAIPRQQFGYVQSKMFPMYLRFIASGQAICLVLYMVLHPWVEADTSERLQHVNLWGSLVSTLVNLFFLEPRATKIMFEKLKMEKEEGRGQDTAGATEGTTLDEGAKLRLKNINRNFSVMHGYSSIVNLLGLLGETWHLWHLSRRLVL